MSADMESDHEQQKKSKKSKRKNRSEDQEAAPADNMDVDEAPEPSKKDKKKKSKDKKRKERAEEDETPAEPAASPEKKHKRQKSEDKKDKKQKRASSPPTTTTTTKSSAAVIPDDKQYPFYTQTFSQRIPVWPAAFDEPLTKISREYLDPQLNRYSPKFKGVLLAYKNVNLSDRPQRASSKNPPTDETPVLLASVGCYAPPFAWLTADLHLFVPSRGAWMEGEINLQSEGHVGVVCFGKFNASISRRSLPKGWTWVEQEETEEEGEEDPFQETVATGEEDGAQEGGESKEDEDSAPRLRSTGYWVDEDGKKVQGKIYFRIKNFSSGSTGDYTFLSLQGTMLDDEAERESAAEERAMEKARRARQNASGLLYPTMRIPESSMTKLKDTTI